MCGSIGPNNICCCCFSFSLLVETRNLEISKIRPQKLPWQVNMKTTPAAHRLLDKSGSKEVPSHSNFCTLAYSHQNSLSGKECQGVLLLFCIADRFIKKRYQNS